MYRQKKISGIEWEKGEGWKPGEGNRKEMKDGEVWDEEHTERSSDKEGEKWRNSDDVELEEDEAVNVRWSQPSQ